MQTDTIHREELQNIISQLEQASYYHQKWHASIIRTLTCGLKPDKHDLSDNAHKECEFGQWFYEYAPVKLTRHPGFIALGEEHHQMHKIATKLLFIANRGLKVPFSLYDSFANSIEKTRLEFSSLQREIIELIHHRDPLTGAMNREYMLPILREQHELVKRTGQPCSVIIMDLDLFKKVNDQYGHQLGDVVLSNVCTYVMDHIRPFDKMFRLGGEEFLLLIQSTNVKTAFDMMERIRVGISELRINIEENQFIQVTASFGITSINPEITVEESIKIADKALNKAKLTGRNCTRNM